MENPKSKIEILFEELFLNLDLFSKESSNSNENVEKVISTLRDIRLLATEKEFQVFFLFLPKKKNLIFLSLRKYSE